MNKKILISVIVLIMLIAGGLFWLNIKNQREITIQPSELVSEVAQDTEDYPELNKKSSDQSGTSNWQTYRNEEFGFEVRYPGNYKIGPRKNLIELEPNDYNKYCLIIIGQRPSFKNILFADWHQKNMTGNQNLSIKEENKNQMVRTVEADGIQTLTNYTYFTNEETAIYLSCNKDKDNSIYNQILSTFKFIN